MFQDRNANDFPEAGFQSNWKKTLSLQDGTSQTDPTDSADAEVQARMFQEGECQTVEPGRSTTRDHDNQENSPSFIAFVMKAVPMLEKELEAVNRSRAFDGYSLLEDDSEKNVRKLHVLACKTTSERDLPFMVSSVSWNSSGNIIAVVYEQKEHEDWCDHETHIDIWHIKRRDFDPGQPYRQIDVSACLTVAQFHPRDPGMLLSGGFTGEIMMWSVNESSGDQMIASSAMQGHREKISSLMWRVSDKADSSLRSSKVLSSALDGKIILWAIDSNAHLLKPARVFLILPDHLPRSLKIRTRSKLEVGATCFSVNFEDDDILLVGTEAGVIFQASLASEVPVPPIDNLGEEIEWRDPVQVVFSGHRGRVIDCQCSPFNRDIFASLGSDQEIHIYSLLNPHAPSLVIHQEESGISRIQWSPVRPMVIAASGNTSLLKLFDLKADKAGSSLEIKAMEKSTHFGLTCLAFNARAHGLLATGDALARVHIWKLNDEYASSSASDIKELQELVNPRQE